MMTRLPLLSAVVVACISGYVTQAGSAPLPEDAVPGIVPLPNRVVPSEGSFDVRRPLQIGVTGGQEARWTAQWLADLLRRTHELNVRIGDMPLLPASPGIVFELGTSAGAPVPESYRLEVSPERIAVSASDAAGIFYGAVSVWQLVSAGANGGTPGSIPALTVDDEPRFRWRGLMLDSARHFIEPSDIRKTIDWMALHKLNVLHWHLTDDQGWRLEIGQYPRLTEVGAWRTPAGGFNAGDRESHRYGGYYTQDEVREIVAYAARRHITVVPEIEMPGHAQAAIAAYPALGTGGDPPAVSADWGVHDYLFNVEESTFDALERILDEVMSLFPGEFIHVGGDEAVKTRWENSARVQARMRELGIADEQALQSYFIRRIEDYLNRHGRRLIGWDEILEGGLAPRATVMSWRGIEGAVAAASQGHDAVLTPAPVLYFDHRQGGSPSEPPGRGAIVSLQDVYEFDPVPNSLHEDERKHILGLQANLWSEHIRTAQRLSYMALPRAAAVAELAWSPEAGQSWEDFLRRLAAQFERYRALDLPFSTSAFDVQVSAEYGSSGDRLAVRLENQSGVGTIHYTTDGSGATAESKMYDAPLTLSRDAVLSTAVFHHGVEVARTAHGSVDLLARRRFSQELKLCSERLALSLEDDAPLTGDRSVFLVDIMNPCWQWPGVDMSRVSGIDVAVGQVPFNFQIGAERDRIELRQPEEPAGELEVRAGGCGGERIALLPLEPARGNDSVTILSSGLETVPRGVTDLCFRFNTEELEPMWLVDWIELKTERTNRR